VNKANKYGDIPIIPIMVYVLNVKCDFFVSGRIYVPIVIFVTTKLTHLQLYVQSNSVNGMKIL
jgi:hypothetical protein